MDNPLICLNVDYFFQDLLYPGIRPEFFQEVPGTYLAYKVVIAVVYNNKFIALEERDEDVNRLVRINTGKIFFNYACHMDCSRCDNRVLFTAQFFSNCLSGNRSDD